MLTAIVLFGSGTAFGADPRLKLSGFGTLGYVATGSSQVSYHTRDGGERADHHGSFKVDSRLGVQGNLSLSERYSGTLQILTRQDDEGDFAPAVEWAFAKAQLTPTVGVRIGRIGAPLFMVSDFREVGYANLQLRSPENVYVQVPLRTFDGADIIGQFETGETLITAQAFVGESKGNLPGDIVLEFNDVVGLNITFEHDITKLRLGHVSTDITTKLPEIEQLSVVLDAATQQSPALEPLAKDFRGGSRKGSFSGVGLELDFDPMFLSAEFTRRRTRDSFAPNLSGWYVAAGYRWGDLTPYVAVSALRQDSRTRPVLTLPPELGALQKPVDNVYRDKSQQAITLGLRWDPLENITLKAQIENVDRETDGENFDNLSPAADGTSVQIYSLALDFVF